MNRVLLLPLLALAAAVPGPVRAETQLCTKIMSLPAVISAQGSYCLGKDLSTSISEGAAIEINANNVTLDCNGYKLGGLAGGPSSTAIGILSTEVQNTVIRNCNLRGFGSAIEVVSLASPYPGGHIVERNRLDGANQQAITVFGTASVVRENVILDTGSGAVAIAIRVEGTVDVIGNLVDGVTTTGAEATEAYGIYTLTNTRATIEDNRIRNLASPLSAFGIHASLDSDALILRRNHFAVDPDLIGGGTSIVCNGANNIATGNDSTGYPNPMVDCADGGHNVYY